MSKNRISSVWDFKQKTLDETNYITHDYLRWYGKLIPPLVSRLIERYTERGDTVLANFAGSGTVLVEGGVRGRNVIGSDTNPLARLLCRVKTNPYAKEDNFLKKCERKISSSEMNFQMDNMDRKWFFKESYQKLMKLKKEIEKIENKKKRDFYKLALASVVKAGSRVDSRCIHHIVVDEDKERKDVFQEFKKKVKNMKESASEYKKLYSNNVNIQIINNNAQKLDDIEDSSIDFIVCHPPYLGAINYSSMYKLENKILGFDYQEIRSKDVSTTSLKKYMKEMKPVFNTMYRVLKENKKCSVIIGDTRKEGDIAPTSSYLINYALENGYRLRDVFIWILNQKAGFNIKTPGNYIDHNYIQIFQKT